MVKQIVEATKSTLRLIAGILVPFCAIKWLFHHRMPSVDEACGFAGVAILLSWYQEYRDSKRQPPIDIDQALPLGMPRSVTKFMKKGKKIKIGKKIHAINAYREETGADLLDAAQQIAIFEAQMRAER